MEFIADDRAGVKSITAGSVLFAITLATLTPAFAQTETIGSLRLEYDNESLRPKTPAQKDFVNEYAAARIAPGREAFDALTHSSYRSCPDTPEQRYFTENGRLIKKDRIPEDAKIIFTPIEDDGALPFAGREFLTNPVKTTVVMAILWKQTINASGDKPMRLVVNSVVENLADDSGKLRIVRGCLTEFGRNKVADRMKKNGDQTKK